MNAVAIRAVIASALTCAVLLVASVAQAAPTITEPSGNPYVVALDTNGQPETVTVKVSGFPAGTLAYVEQCNGRSPGDENWAPVRDCDLGSSPAAGIVDPQGNAVFDAADRNHAFHPFVGESPQQQFNCLTPDGKSSTNGLTDYRGCKIRVSSNNNVSTADQVFLPIAFAQQSSGSSSSTSSGSSSNAGLWIAIVLVVAVAAIAATVVLSRRRTRART